MKRKLFETLSVLLALTLLLGAAGLTAFADEDEGIVEYEMIYNDIWYNRLPDGTIELEQYYGKETYLEVPEIIDGSTVTSIGDAFQGCKTLEEVVLPDTLTAISAGAFSGCSNLKKLNIPNSVARIEDNAFSLMHFLGEH